MLSLRLGLCCMFRDQPIKFVTTTATAIGKLTPWRRCLGPLKSPVDRPAPSRWLSDLSPLNSRTLVHLSCSSTPVSDLSPLENFKRLAMLDVRATKVTSTSVAVLQKALPNCKIDWDDPAKPKTPDPAAFGSK